MKCPSCNKEYDESFRFCPSCGTELKGAIESQPVSNSDETPLNTQPSMRAAGTRWKYLSRLVKSLLLLAGIMLFSAAVSVLRVEVFSQNTYNISVITDTVRATWFLLMAAVIVYPIFSKVKRRTSVSIPKSDPVGYQQFVDRLNAAITGIGYTTSTQTPELNLYRKKIKRNKYVVVVLLLFALAAVISSSVNDFKIAGSFWTQFNFFLPDYALTSFVFLAPLIIYLSLSRGDKTIRIQTVDAPEAHSLTIGIPLMEYFKFKRFLYPV